MSAYFEAELDVIFEDDLQTNLRYFLEVDLPLHLADLKGEAYQVALARLDETYGNLEKWINHAIAKEVPAMYEVVLEVCMGLESYLRLRGYWDQKLAWGLALRDWQFKTTTQIDVRLLNSIATAYSERGWYDNAIFTYKAILAAIRDDPSKQGALARVYNNLGVACWRRGELAEAEIFLNQALQLQLDLADDGRMVVQLQANLSQVMAAQGHKAEALDMTREAVATARLIGDEWLRAQLMSVLAKHLMGNGLFEEAEACFETTLTLLDAIKDRIGLAQARYDYALLCYRQQQPARALDLAQQSYRAFDELGHVDAETALQLVDKIRQVYVG